jgi:3-oxoacyl-[acyl-carrier-protein] synthase II
MGRRVVVTGLGILSPVGVEVDTYWRALVSGTSGVRPVTRFEVGDYPIQAAAEITSDFKPRDYIPKEHRKALKVMAWDIQLGVAAAMSAVQHSGIITETRRVDPTRLGVSFGCGSIASDVDELGPALVPAVKPGQSLDFRLFGTEAMKTFFPLWMLKYLPNMPACHISIFCDAQGPNNSITTGDAASTQALGEAYRVIERGSADVMICGGVDGKVNPLSFIRYQLLGNVNLKGGKPEEMSRPFEKSRCGFVIGEGAAAVILEELEHARARGAKIYAELTGYGSACDAYDVDRIHPDGRGMCLALKNALRDAKLKCEDVDAVFANAKGTVEGDRAESRALNTVFGKGTRGVRVTSTKSMIGYISAAMGVMDAVAASCAVGANTIPPTINYHEPDPECAVNVVANTACETELNHVVVSSGGFGGQFAVLVISKCR